MRIFILSCLLSLWTVAAHAQSASEFQLPPDPDTTPSAPSQAQGPVDLEGETRTAPRVITSPTPTPRASAMGQPIALPDIPPPAANATARPTVTASPSPRLPATDSPVLTRDILNEPSSRAAARSTDDSTVSTSTGTTSEPGREESAPADDALTFPDINDSSDISPTTIAPTNELDATQDSLALPWSWSWIGAALAALLLIIAVLVGMRRRRGVAAAMGAPTPVATTDATLHKVSEFGQPAADEAGSLDLEAQVTTLSRSLLNATISYRLTLINRSRVPVSQIQIHGDVTTAHGRVPASQQLADVHQEFPELHSLARLAPGERSTISGELRIPLREVRALRQGSVPVFVPLLRLTARAENIQPRAFTYVIGSAEEKGVRPNPFRLDEGPRSYAQLSTRALA